MNSSILHHFVRNEWYTVGIIFLSLRYVFSTWIFWLIPNIVSDEISQNPCFLKLTYFPQKNAVMMLKSALWHGLKSGSTNEYAVWKLIFRKFTRANTCTNHRKMTNEEMKLGIFCLICFLSWVERMQCCGWGNVKFTCTLIVRLLLFPLRVNCFDFECTRAAAEYKMPTKRKEMRLLAIRKIKNECNTNSFHFVVH